MHASKKTEEIAAALLINIWEPLQYLKFSQEFVLDLDRMKEDALLCLKNPEQKGRESKIKRIIACSQMCRRRMTWERRRCPPSIIAICFQRNGSCRTLHIPLSD